VAVAGTIKLTTTYSGDSTHKGSTGSSSLSIGKRSTSVALALQPSTVGPRGNSTITVVVTDTSGGSNSFPSGLVAFSASVPGGSFGSLTCSLVQLNTYKSQCTVTYTAPNTSSRITITISAKYGGDSSHLSSTGSKSLTVT
jgi:hypothetical protein